MKIEHLAIIFVLIILPIDIVLGLYLNAQIDTIRNLAEEKIIESAKRITSADFTISPKVKGKVNYGCGYCKYRDICFRTPDDVEELPKRTLKDVLGGEE